MKFTFLLFFLILNGCASLSQEDCSQMDWKARGQSDALKGITSPKHIKYAEQCREFGVSIKKKSYLLGYKAGLNLYCNYKNGYELGLEGKDAHLYCEKYSPTFKQGFNKGYDQFLTKRRKEEERKQTRAQLLSINGSFECPKSMICKREDECQFGYCKNSGNKCNFDHQCEEVGHCMPVTGYTPSRELVTVNICKFIKTR